MFKLNSYNIENLNEILNIKIIKNDPHSTYHINGIERHQLEQLVEFCKESSYHKEKANYHYVNKDALSLQEIYRIVDKYDDKSGVRPIKAYGVVFVNKDADEPYINVSISDISIIINMEVNPSFIKINNNPYNPSIQSYIDIIAKNIIEEVSNIDEPHYYTNINDVFICQNNSVDVHTAIGWGVRYK